MPDLRGFGGSDGIPPPARFPFGFCSTFPCFSPSVLAPPNASSYTFKVITADLAALLDHLKIGQAIFLGHDWGGEVVWKMTLYHPKRVLAVGAVCTPFTPRLDEFIPLETLVEILPAFRYQLFLSSDAAPPELNGDVGEDLFT